MRVEVVLVEEGAARRLCDGNHSPAGTGACGGNCRGIFGRGKRRIVLCCRHVASMLPSVVVMQMSCLLKVS